MGKIIKNIRKLKNTKLFFISDDTSIKEQVQKALELEFKYIKYISSSDYTDLKSISSSDIIVFDLDMNKDVSKDIFLKIKNTSLSIPKIAISSDDDEEKILFAINIQAYTFLTKSYDLLNLKLAIIMCINQTNRSDKIELGNGIYFDEYRDQFFKKNGSIIDFTRLEKSFLKLLINRRDKITDYQIIKDIVWKDKDMSIYTMRNIVNKIRQKTYYDIVKNHSSKGYTIDTMKN